MGQGADSPEAVTLRQVLAERALTPVHMLDLLEAFRRDVSKRRYDDLGRADGLLSLLRRAGGRFVLDVHGEDRAIWPASDALCAALQVINHLQDCRKDYRELDRVYLPKDALVAFDARIEMLDAEGAHTALLADIRALAWRTQELLRAARPFAAQIRDFRLALEVGAIQRLAESLTRRLADPPIRYRSACVTGAGKRPELASWAWGERFVSGSPLEIYAERGHKRADGRRRGRGRARPNTEQQATGSSFSRHAPAAAGRAVGRFSRLMGGSSILSIILLPRFVQPA